MGILEAITAGLQAVAKVFGYAQQRDAEKNTAPMQQGAEAVQEQKADDAVNEAIKNKDVDQIRKDLAE